MRSDQAEPGVMIVARPDCPWAECAYPRWVRTRHAPASLRRDCVLSQCLRPTTAALRSARDGVRAALAGRAPEDVIDDAVLVVSELVSNSVRHAGLGGDERIIVTVHAGETIRVEVEDPGPGFDGSLPPKRPPLEGGQGLRVVERVSARWGTARGPRTVVWAELRRSP